MKIFRFVAPILLLASGLLLAGCVGGPKARGITEELVGIYATEASLAKKQITIALRYSNENIASLGFTDAWHKVFLNGTLVGKVAHSEPFGIPPVAAVTQYAVVELEHPEVIEKVLAQGATTTIAYHVESSLSQTIYEDKLSYSLTTKGSIELQHSAPPAPAK